MVNLYPWTFLETHFAAARLRHYLNRCNGDTDKARELYLWNTEMGAACWESLGYLEVGLRNSLDRQMVSRHLAKQRSGSWVFDEAGELGRDLSPSENHLYPYKDLAKAQRQVRQNKRAMDAGQIISEVSFGFWHQLVSKKQKFLWPDLVGAFPYMSGREQTAISDLVGSLRLFRNRIGHHHRIWSIDVGARQREVIELAGYIDPDLARWIKDSSRVYEVLSRKPKV